MSDLKYQTVDQLKQSKSDCEKYISLEDHAKAVRHTRKLRRSYPSSKLKRDSDTKSLLNKKESEMEFKEFSSAVRQQSQLMEGIGQFLYVDTSSDDIWQKYLSSFPVGSNPIYKERTEHDCSTCKSFIRQAGNIVVTDGQQLYSIWDVNLEGPYGVVAKAMSQYVKSKVIKNIFLTDMKKIGVEVTYDTNPDAKITSWSHFSITTPQKSKCKCDDIGTQQSQVRGTYDVFKRGMDEISTDALNTTIELIAQGSLYRGEEFDYQIKAYRGLKTSYDQTENKDLFLWAAVTSENDGLLRLRNTSIGTLLIDLSEGVELDQAVAKFEAIVAPSNYKRTTALITGAMIKNAQAKLEELGLTDSIHRRHAKISDITINNVLFADRSVKQNMNVFDELASGAKKSVNVSKKVEEIHIEDFIEKVLPNISSMQVVPENKHTNNFITLVAPTDPDAKHLFKWDNNFSWVYNGDVTDSLKERVKKAGGRVDGFLRFSLQWNENNEDTDIDLDAHAHTPSGQHIYYSNPAGHLDVDNTHPGAEIAVENITWLTRAKTPKGEYQFRVYNFSSKRCEGGFSAELEMDGVIHSFSYGKPIAGRSFVDVATIRFDDKFKIVSSLPSSESIREVWGINTQSTADVEVIMKSPNHWDDNKAGNKHYFFMLRGCKNPDPVRGFFNEYLKGELTEHRKVFEVLGSKMKAEPVNDQLSGLGFSSTVRNSIVCKVKGSFNRTLKINF
jgi:hypothetical protein